LAAYRVKNLNITFANNTYKRLQTPAYNSRILVAFSSFVYECKDKNAHTRTAILFGYLYGCENCSPTLREYRALRVFQNRVVRRILGRGSDKRVEIAG
jgi:hypothetical protein